MKMLNSSDNKMTIFYSKRSGDIKGFTSGVTDFTYYGDDREDMEVIYDFIVVDYDDYVLDNAYQFIVENDRVKLKDDVDLGKYL